MSDCVCAWIGKNDREQKREKESKRERQRERRKRRRQIFGMYLRETGGEKRERKRAKDVLRLVVGQQSQPSLNQVVHIGYSSA